jgi:hypothetical protein
VVAYLSYDVVMLDPEPASEVTAARPPICVIST